MSSAFACWNKAAEEPSQDSRRHEILSVVNSVGEQRVNLPCRGRVQATTPTPRCGRPVPSGVLKLWPRYIGARQWRRDFEHAARWPGKSAHRDRVWKELGEDERGVAFHGGRA